MRFSKQTVLPLSIQLLILIAIYKKRLQFLHYRENTIFENNWKPEEIAGQNPLSTLILQEQARKNKTAHMNCPDTTVPLGNPVFNRLVRKC